MKLSLLILAFMVTCVGCQSTGNLKPVSQVKPGIAKDKSLGNEKLISDVTKGIESIEGGISIDPATIIAKFVIQQPKGSSGSRAWREFWIVDPEGSPLKYMITFRENGYNSANFNIKKM
jgi:hypothetical protein